MKLTYVKLTIVNSTPFYFSRGIYNTIEILSSLTSLSLRPFPLSARKRLGASLGKMRYIFSSNKVFEVFPNHLHSYLKVYLHYLAFAFETLHYPWIPSFISANFCNRHWCLLALTLLQVHLLFRGEAYHTNCIFISLHFHIKILCFCCFDWANLVNVAIQT